MSQKVALTATCYWHWLEATEAVDITFPNLYVLWVCCILHANWRCCFLS